MMMVADHSRLLHCYSFDYFLRVIASPTIFDYHLPPFAYVYDYLHTLFSLRAFDADEAAREI